MADDEGTSGIDTALNVGRLATGFIPGAQLIDPALAGFQGSREADREEGELRAAGFNPEKDSQSSRGMKKKFEQLRTRWSSRIGEAVVSAGGALAGAVIGTMIFPVVGTLAGLVVGGIGSLAGALVADKVYNAFNPPDLNDPITLSVQLDTARRQGRAVSPEEVFAMVAPSVPNEAVVKQMEDILEQHTGTRVFNEALGTEKGRAAIRQLMRDFDDIIPRPVGLVTAPGITMSEEYAKRINNGTIRPRDMVFDDGRGASRFMAADMAMPDAYLPGKPRGNARSY